MDDEKILRSRMRHPSTPAASRRLMRNQYLQLLYMRVRQQWMNN
jgi:hypothetical protein